MAFAVSDSGIGMAPEQARGLFEPFHQGDSSTSRQFGGTGLGLALSKRLAQTMCGTLRLARSAPGEGSTFVLELDDAGPLHAPVKVRKLERHETSQHPPAFNVRSHDLDGMKVLVVDDTEDSQLILRIFLNQSGAQVETAANGKDGVALARAREYDVVLMDIQMPELDGYQAAAQLRENGYKKPVIALTAHALKGEREKCLKSGFTDFLSKPIAREDLIGHLREFLGPRSASV